MKKTLKISQSTPSRSKTGRLTYWRIYLLIGGLVAISGLTVSVIFSGCGEIREMSTQIAQEAGLVSADQAESINKSAQAIEKTQEDLTPEQEYYIGRAVVAEVLKSYKPLDNPQANQYLNLLGQSLAVFSDRPETFAGYHFLLLDSDEVNAFAAPGGLILVTRGMVRCCENEDELAAVLAHEICHVEKRHGLRAIKQGRLTEAFTIIAAESAKQFGDEKLASLTREFEASVGDVVMTLTTNGYSRTQEKDADASAVELLRRAGYSETSMITMLNRMNEKLSHSGGLGFAKTHPSAASRADTVRPMISNATSAPDIVRLQRFSANVQPVLAGM